MKFIVARFGINTFTKQTNWAAAGDGTTTSPKSRAQLDVFLISRCIFFFSEYGHFRIAPSLELESSQRTVLTLVLVVEEQVSMAYTKVYSGGWLGVRAPTHASLRRRPTGTVDA